MSSSSSSSSPPLSTGGTRIEYDEKRVPVGVLAVAHSLKFPVVPLPSLSPSPVLYIAGVSEPISGSPYILRHLARLSQSTLPVYGDNANEATQIDYLIDLSKPLADKRHLGTLAEKLNTHLLTRSFLVGHSLSIADLAAYESILLNTRWPAFQKDASALSSYPHFFRWFNFISGQALVADSLAAYKAAKEAKAKQLYEQSFSGSFDVDLPGAAMGKVVTRFPPEPSGYLHIGHAKALLINEIIARRYQGKLIVRFDDTNPNKEKAEYEQSIKDDINTLGVQWDRLTYTSDYFKELEKYAVFLLNKGRAYIDDTPVEQMRKERMDGIESKCRNRSVEENLRLFQLMLEGDEEGLKCCMRAKIDMSANNKTLRDPVLYRCNLTPHHRTGDKFKAYPTYDFAVPIVDSLEGVTHAMRTIEYRDRDEQYQWVLTATEMKHRPIIREYARLNFKFSVMSKRKLQWFVDQKLVEGWYDPRFPTIQGTMRRGMTVSALREYIKSQGFSIANTFQEWDKIWAINMSVIDPIAPRFIAVAANNRVPLTLTNISGEQLITAPLHPKNASVGTKVISRSSLLWLEQADAKTIANGEEITLMNWGNTIIDSIEKSADGTVLSMKGRYHAEGDAKKTDKKLTWVGGAEADLVPISLVEFDHLITIEKIEEDTKIEDVVNRDSKVETAAVGEAALRSLKKGDVIQLMRRGFFRVDQACLGPKQPLILFMIPDGKTKAMSTLGTAVDKAKGSGTVQKNAKKEKAAEKK